MWDTKKIKKILTEISSYAIPEIENTLISFFIKRNGITDIQNTTLLESMQWENKKILTLLEYHFDDLTFDDMIHFFELLIPDKDKEINWAFFTPSIIVEKIINEIDIKKWDLILDPSCWCGAFLVGASRYLKDNFALSYKEIFRTYIYWIDLAEYSVTRAKKLLSLLATLWWEKDNFEFNIFVWNSLSDADISKKLTNMYFDKIIWNPPYVKYQDLEENIRWELSNNWRSISTWNYNLYFAFFELWYSLLKPNGKLWYITPNNYFTSLAGESLRKFFSSKKCIYKIIDFKDKKVFSALTYTAITFLSKEPNDSILYDHIDTNESIDMFIENIHFDIVIYATLEDTKWRLLLKKDKENIKKIETMSTNLGTICSIKNWIATCKDEVYLVEECSQWKYYKFFHWEKYEIEASILRKIYKISHIVVDIGLQEQGSYIIFPYKKIWKSFQIIDEEKMMIEFPKTYRYLIARKNDLKNRDKWKKTYEAWYSYARLQGLNAIWAKLLTPTFSAKPRFILDTQEDSFFLNWYWVYIKTPTSLWWGLNLHILYKILNSKVMDYYITKTSVSIAGGYYCYQKNFIERFWIPDLSDTEIKYLENLSDKEKIDTFLIKKYHITI